MFTHSSCISCLFYVMDAKKKSSSLLCWASSDCLVAGRTEERGDEEAGARRGATSFWLIQSHFFSTSKCSEKSSLTLYHDSRRFQLLSCTGTRTGCTLPVWRVTQLLITDSNCELFLSFFLLNWMVSNFVFCLHQNAGEGPSTLNAIDALLLPQ